MTDKPAANGEAQASTEARTDGPANLDALLKEFDQPGKPEKTQGDQTTRLLSTFKPVIEFAQTEMASRAQAETNKTIKAAIDFVKKEDATKDFPDKVIRGLLGTYADEDESFRTAFVGRHQNPGVWDSKLSEVRTKIMGDLKGYGQIADNNRVTSDVLAARAAISGGSSTPAASTKGPSPQEKFQMSDREWRDYLDGQRASAKG